MQPPPRVSSYKSLFDRPIEYNINLVVRTAQTALAALRRRLRLGISIDSNNVHPTTWNVIRRCTQRGLTHMRVFMPCPLFK